MLEPYNGNGNYVFVSYAHGDSKLALTIINALVGAGYNVWYDAGVEAGSEWPDYIAKRVEQCKCFLALVSKASAESRNCRSEIGYALELKKEMLVVYLENVELGSGMHMQLGIIQAIHRDRFDTEEAFLRMLLDAKLIQSCRVREPLPSSKPAPSPNELVRAYRFPLVPVAIGLAAIAIIAFFAVRHFSNNGLQVPSSAVASTVYNGHTYALIEEDDDWFASKARCESYGGHLATITSDEEQQKAINSLLKSGHKNSYWIGGKRDVSGNWTWVTGEAFIYSNWCDSVAAEDSMVVYRKDDALKKGYPSGCWNDLHHDGKCSSEVFFGLENIGAICEWDSVLEASSSGLNAGQTEKAEEENTGSTGISLLDASVLEQSPLTLPWVPSGTVASGTWGGHTYALVEQSEDWESAKARFELYGGYLATISSEDEQRMIEGLLANGVKNAYWIGGELGFDGAWGWVTGEVFEYTNWAEGQPDDRGEASESDSSTKENALMLYRATNPNFAAGTLGYWNDLAKDGTCGDEPFFGPDNMGAIFECDVVL